MAQYDILEMMQNTTQKWWTAEEISVKQGIGKTSTNHSLNKLQRSGFVLRETMRRNNLYYSRYMLAPKMGK